MILTMAVAHARFAGVWFRVAAAQVYTMAFEPKHPPMYRNEAKYRAALLSVATVMMKPATAKQRGKAMWKPRSLLRSLENAIAKEMIVPIMYGGAVQTRVIVLEPRLKPLTIDGKKLLKP